MMRKSVWLGAAAVVLLALAAPRAWAEEVDAAKVAEKAIEAGDPDNVDPNLIKGENWTYDFTFENPEPVIVNTPGLGQVMYWYLVYTVTNRTGKEHNFVPAFTLYATNTSLQRAGVYPLVFEAIKKQRKIRFLENAVQMIGKVLPGDDNARTGVAIFGPMPRETENFSIFVEGLSGLYIQKPNPEAAPAPAAAPEAKPEAKAEAEAKPAAKAEAKPQPAPEAKVEAKTEAKIPTPASVKASVLRKTLVLTYRLPGDQWWLNQDPPIFAKKAWTWR
jgi:hypothetical protein